MSPFSPPPQSPSIPSVFFSTITPRFTPVPGFMSKMAAFSLTFCNNEKWCDRNIFHKHLQCQSPPELVSILAESVASHPAFALEKPLHVLDVGAGNGIVAAEVRAQLVGRVRRLVGTDILPEAHEAAMRDRPNVYDQYVVADLLDERQVELFGKKQFDVMITCAALGPGWNDMPIQALQGAMAVVKEGGLVAITVNVCWLGKADETPWGQFIAMLDGKETKTWGQRGAAKEIQASTGCER